jgi:hypothetical protein
MTLEMSGVTSLTSAIGILHEEAWQVKVGYSAAQSSIEFINIAKYNVAFRGV